MRLSVREWDRGYNPVLAKDATVYLNGKPVNDCVCADEEFGEVHILVRDLNGDLIPMGNEVRTKVLQGKVRIRFDK